MNALNTLTSWLHPPTTPSRPAATTPAERRKTLADIAAERSRSAVASARDAERFASAAADVRQAETQLADARRRHADLGAEQIGRSLTHEWRISSLQAHLCAGAPEFLDRFLMDLDVLTDATRLQFKVLKSVAGLRDDVTGAR